MILPPKTPAPTPFSQEVLRRLPLAEAERRMHTDGALDTDDEIPFDASRLILGCFVPFSVMGRQ